MALSSVFRHSSFVTHDMSEREPQSAPEPKPLFPLGQVVGTPGALAALQKVGQTPLSFLTRHVGGDWGDLVDEDKALNDNTVQDGGRIFSAYILEDETKIWLITEADRSVTTFLLPEEY